MMFLTKEERMNSSKRKSACIDSSRWAKPLSISSLGLLLFFVVNTGFADVVRLTDKSHLNMKVKSFSKGNYEMETSFAGVLRIAQTKVRDIITVAPVFVALESGSTILGKLDFNGKMKKVNTGQGVVDISKDTILAIWVQGAENPLAPQPEAGEEKRKWKHEVNSDIFGKTGNSEKITLAGGIKSTLSRKKDRLLLYLRGQRSRENSQTTTKEIFAGVDFESSFKSDRHSMYIRSEAEIDDIELVDLRSTTGLGYGYFFKKEKDVVFRGRTGLQLRYEKFETGDTNTAPGLDLGLYYMKKINAWTKLVSDITYGPSFKDLGDYRIYHESSLEMPLGKSDFWKFRLGISNEYNSLVVKGKDRLDTTYFGRLVLSWE
jgi:putative salt-induced outer membrane protein YdiY